MKKKHVIIAFLILCFIASIALINNVNFNKEQVASKYLPCNKRLTNINKHIIPADIAKKVLNMCYVESDRVAIFSSVSLFRSVNWYDLYWSSKVIELMGKNAEIQKDISLLITSNESSINYEKERMEFISNIIELHKMLGIEFERKNEIIRILERRFITTEKLFFDVDPNENLKNKVYITKYALLIIENLNVEEEKFNISEIKDGIASMYNNNSFFSDDFDEALFGVGTAIIDFLSTFNITYDKLNSEQLNTRSAWLKKLNNQYKDTVDSNEYTPIGVIKLITLSKLNKYFNNNLIIDNRLLDSIFKQQNFIGGFGPYDSNIDPSSTFDVMYLCQLNNYEYKNKDMLYKHIERQIDTGFVQTGDLPISIEDNYYGLALANAFGSNYNTDKMEKFADESYITYIEDNCSINDFDKMQKIQHILLTYKELNKEIKNKDAILKNITDFLNHQSDSLEEYTFFKSFRVGFEVSFLCNKNICAQYKSLLEDRIDLYFKNNTEYDLHSLYEITKIIEYTNSRNKYFDKLIAKEIEKLYYKGGFKLYDNSNSSTSIFNLSKGLYVMDYVDGLNSIVLNEVKEYISESIDIKHFFYSDDRKISPADLRTIYQGCFASTYIYQP